MIPAPRAFLLIVAISIVIATLCLFPYDAVWRSLGSPGPKPAGGQAASSPSAAAIAPQIARGSGEAPSEIAAALNAPEGNVRRDLAIASELFVAWQSSFPREGNPVGDNAEITAALTGGNRVEFAFLPRTHRAINARGELCDRWGTPFRFHQVSGTHMEIRSAGPDRRFATADDAQWPPE